MKFFAVFYGKTEYIKSEKITRFKVVSYKIPIKKFKVSCKEYPN